MEASASFLPEGLDCTLTIENENAEVSPGGELTFKVNFSDMSLGFSIYHVGFNVSDKSVVKRFSTNQLSWEYMVNMSHPRYAKIVLKDDIEGDLPKTVTLNIFNQSTMETIATADFTILADGTTGHSEYKGKYVHDIAADLDHYRGLNAWYRISCMPNSTGKCNINIKSGNYSKYTGNQVRVAHHSVSDKGYPGGSVLKVNEPVIFDARKMIIKNTENLPPSGEKLFQEEAICRFISDQPFMIEMLHPNEICDEAV